MIYINGKPHNYKKQQNLAELFDSLDIKPEKGIAVAVNNSVILKTNWKNYLVNREDKILLIKASQGG